jgi:hypothetical protein
MAVLQIFCGVLSDDGNYDTYLELTTGNMV